MDAQLELLALACFADPVRDIDPAVDAFADWQCGQPLTLTAEQARAAIRCCVVASQLLELVTAARPVQRTRSKRSDEDPARPAIRPATDWRHSPPVRPVRPATTVLR